MNHQLYLSIHLGYIIPRSLRSSHMYAAIRYIMCNFSIHPQVKVAIRQNNTSTASIYLAA